jgi:hypothetical protein
MVAILPPSEPPAAAKDDRPVLATVSVEAPMTRIPNDPYCQRRVDMALSDAESKALRYIYDGLCVKGELPRNPVPADAIRWLLRRYGEAFAAASK